MKTIYHSACARKDLYMVTQKPQCIPINQPLPLERAAADTFNPEKFLEKVLKQNFLNFINKKKEIFKKALMKKKQDGISLFPVNLEKQAEEDATEMAINLFVQYKQEGYLDDLNRFSEKFYKLGGLENAG
ncbi:MAG: hypothetical protein NC191_09615 [Muribaculaceae bacterium]|nr:hypothetical protein [Muribaculaceae bacterium]